MDKDMIKLDNRDFLVIDKVTYQDENYLYVIAVDGKNDITILHEYEKMNKKYVESITDRDLIDKIFYIVAHNSSRGDI